MPTKSPDEACKAVKAAFDAMSTWQTEVAHSGEKNLERVIDKVAAAAEALGWPEQIADAVRTQMQAITKMQSQMMVDDQCLGGTNGITKPAVSDFIEAEIFADATG